MQEMRLNKADPPVANNTMEEDKKSVPSHKGRKKGFHGV